MTTNIMQSIIYTSAPNKYVDYALANANVSGLGTSQVLTITTPSVLPAGTTVACVIQAPRPTPLFYIASNAATTSYSFYTTGNIPITTTAFASTGFFNQGYFQPNPGQKFVLFITVGAVTTANQVLLSIQTVVENTLSQYVDMGTIKFEHISKCRIQPSIRCIVTGNSQSAIPNTFAFDFVDYPLTEQENALVKFKGLLNAQATLSYGAIGSMASSSTSSQFVVVAGQWSSIMYPGKGSYYSGSIFLLINNIGNLSLPSTTFSNTLPTIFDDSDFDSAVGSPSLGENSASLNEIKMLLMEKFGKGEYRPDETDSDEPNGMMVSLTSLHDRFDKMDLTPTRMSVDKSLSIIQQINTRMDALYKTNKAEHDRMFELLHSHTLALNLISNAIGLNEERPFASG